MKLQLIEEELLLTDISVAHLSTFDGAESSGPKDRGDEWGSDDVSQGMTGYSIELLRF